MSSTALTAPRLEQERLRHRVILQDRFSSLDLVAGVDVAFADQGRWSKAAIVVMTYPDLHLVETAIAVILPCLPAFLAWPFVMAIRLFWAKCNQSLIHPLILMVKYLGKNNGELSTLRI
ncbi:MAG: hypothetical protein RLZZ490_945 [Cyanobacteriota bacterium]